MDSDIPYFEKQRQQQQQQKQQQQSSQRVQRSPELEAVHRTLSDISSGIRILEDRYYNLRKKTQLTDQALLEAQKSFSEERRILYDQIMEAKMKLQDMVENVELMRQELRDAVRQKDLKILEKYLDMWEPMQFVTRGEVEKLFEQIEFKRKPLNNPEE